MISRTEKGRGKVAFPPTHVNDIQLEISTKCLVLYCTNSKACGRDDLPLASPMEEDVRKDAEDRLCDPTGCVTCNRRCGNICRINVCVEGC